jgi:REP element-mobilizing transposase RayT
MPRPHRIHEPGLTYHVTNRAVARSLLYEHDDERNLFLRLLGSFAVRLKIVILAWVLIPNHYHLLLRVSTWPLAKLMQEVEGRFARALNDTRIRQGHLFQGRYFDEIVRTDERFQQLFGYIPGNAVDAGQTTLDAIATYPWTSFSALAGNVPPIPGHDPSLALAAFSPNRTRALDYHHRIIESEVARMADARDTRDVVVCGYLQAHCNRIGVDIEEVLSGSLRQPAVQARAATVRQARATGMTDTQIARGLRISRRTLFRLASGPKLRKK